MWKAEHKLGLLVWSGKLKAGDTISVMFGSRQDIYAIRQAGGDLWFCHAFGKERDSPTYTLPGVLYGVCLVGHPVRYVKNHLKKYVFDIPHAI